MKKKLLSLFLLAGFTIITITLVIFTFIFTTSQKKTVEIQNKAKDYTIVYTPQKDFSKLVENAKFITKRMSPVDPITEKISKIVFVFTDFSPTTSESNTDPTSPMTTKPMRSSISLRDRSVIYITISINNELLTQKDPTFLENMVLSYVVGYLLNDYSQTDLEKPDNVLSTTLKEMIDNKQNPFKLQIKRT